MNTQPVVLTETISYRNLNLCPHCDLQGQESLLDRRTEGVPMISRSDGWSSHLLLADEPQAYPAESGSADTNLVSVCFWYSHVNSGAATRTSIALVPEGEYGYAAFFRRIEQVADLLAERLGKFSALETLYRLEGDRLEETGF